KTQGRDWDLSVFLSHQEAYHQLIADLAVLSACSLRLLSKRGAPDAASAPRNVPLYVDGGFASSGIFMTALTSISPWQPVYSAQVPQSTALGAALLMHARWQEGPVPEI